MKSEFSQEYKNRVLDELISRLEDGPLLDTIYCVECGENVPLEAWYADRLGHTREILPDFPGRLKSWYKASTNHVGTYQRCGGPTNIKYPFWARVAMFFLGQKPHDRRRLWVAILLPALTACVVVSDPLQPFDPGTCFYCVETDSHGACPVGIPWKECSPEQALESKCSGHAACGSSVGIPLDAGRDAYRDLDTGIGISISHCDRCLETYFSACTGCTCAEVDSGTLVTCGECPGQPMNVNYSCVGVP